MDKYDFITFIRTRIQIANTYKFDNIDIKRFDNNNDLRSFVYLVDFFNGNPYLKPALKKAVNLTFIYGFGQNFYL